jgi:hypothetical protein
MRLAAKHRSTLPEALNFVNLHEAAKAAFSFWWEQVTMDKKDYEKRG